MPLAIEAARSMADSAANQNIEPEATTDTGTTTDTKAATDTSESNLLPDADEIEAQDKLGQVAAAAQPAMPAAAMPVEVRADKAMSVEEAQTTDVQAADAKAVTTLTPIPTATRSTPAATTTTTPTAAVPATTAPVADVQTQTADKDKEVQQAASKPVPRRICPYCGNIAGRGKFCISCGKPMDTTADVPMPAAENIATESFQKPSLTSNMVAPYPVSPSSTNSTTPSNTAPGTTAPSNTTTNNAAGNLTIGNATTGTATTGSATNASTPSADAQQQTNGGGLRRIPPPSMPSVYGIRTHNSLSPRMSPSQTASSAAEGSAPSSPPNNSSNPNNQTSSIAFRTVNPSWTKQPPQ
jgi:hypothetical protein